MDVGDRRRRATQEAAEWLLRLQSEDMTRSERAHYADWLRESTLHVGEMLRLSRLHSRLTHFRGWKDISRPSPRELRDSSVERPWFRDPVAVASVPMGRRLSLFWVGVATAFSVAILVGGYWLRGYPQTIETAAAERRNLRLPDGSVAQLSPETTIRMHFTARSRDLMLSRGDALFRVIKDPSRPFLVQADHTRIRAVGTAFGVEHSGDSVIVTVEEGRVSVQHAAASAAATATPAPITEVSLGADQQIVVPRAGPLGLVRRVDSRRELAWAEGRLIFDQDPMAEVVRQFNRYNRIQIQIVNRHLAERRISAVFNASDPEAFILFLESEANVRITRTSPNSVVIDSEGPN